jgi:membrane protease YdiL (CAAX protease family)
VIANRSRPAPSTARLIQAGSVLSGLFLLLLRPALATTVGWTVPVVMAVFVGVLILGVAAPVGPEGQSRARSSQRLVVLTVGLFAFAAGRLLAGGHAPIPASGLIVALNTFAAVAEEALFRRLAFALLLPAGPACAIAGSSLLFGLAHVTVYGWWALPVDTAAGAVLGWQRWASGSWAVPAVTHAVADLLVVV